MCAFVSPLTIGALPKGQLTLTNRLCSRTCNATNKRYSLHRIVYACAPSDIAKPNIRLMACDLDGTMLNSSTKISSKNAKVTKKLISDTDVVFIPATGKSRPGALRAMGELGKYFQERYPKGCPGVYLQGLIVYGCEGEIVFENTCDERLVETTVTIAEDLGLDLIAYNRGNILCEKRSVFTDLLPSYAEPAAEEIGVWESVIGKRPINKLIIMAEPDEINRVRPYVESKIGSDGHLTQAQGNMLEVLPPGASKGLGVRHFLDYMKIPSDNVLAIGDAENDLELLQMVGYSCAVANALPSVKAAAKFTNLRSNDEDGVAEAIERFILGGAKIIL